MPEWRITHVWDVVKESYYFPEGKEPYEWVKSKLDQSWRSNKCNWRNKLIEGETKDQAIKNRPTLTPVRQWKNFVEFCFSEEGQKRRERGIENQKNSKLRHYCGTKTLARRRNEKMITDGKEPDELTMFQQTHMPKSSSKHDTGTAATMAKIDRKLEELPQDLDETARIEERKKIFVAVAGEDKNGCAKTYGLGVKVPRSGVKRSLLAQEQEKNRKLEAELKDVKQSLKSVSERVNFLIANMTKRGRKEGSSSCDNEVYYEEQDGDDGFEDDDI